MSQRTCKDCDAAFEFGAEEQAFFEKKGFAPPKRCPGCRAKRRQDRPPPPPELHEVQCSACGTLTQVPFQPSEKRPVYCEDCFTYR